MFLKSRDNVGYRQCSRSNVTCFDLILPLTTMQIAHNIKPELNADSYSVKSEI